MRTTFNIISGLAMLAFVVVIIAVPHTDVNETKKVLIHSGYKPINVGGYDFFNGDKNDFYKTKFTAVAQNGDTVTGCVTKGLFLKGNTIRLN